MNDCGAYGTWLAEAFHLRTAPAFVTRTIDKTEIAVTQVILWSRQQGVDERGPG